MSWSLAMLVAMRWLQFASLALVFGSALFPFYAPMSAGARSPAGRIAIASSLTVFLSAAAWAAASLVDAAGDPGALGDPEALSAFFLETSFGHVWLLRLVLAAALPAIVVATRTAVFGRNGPTAMVASIAAALLASQAWVGHASSGSGLERAVVIAAYAAHVLGAGAWLGGLAPLGRMLARARANDAAARLSIDLALRRFSSVGMASVAAILAGGAVVALVRTGSISTFAASGWGRLVLLKIALLAAMLAIAARNRFQLMPDLMRRPDDSLARLGRNVALEQAVGLLVLGAAAWLGVVQAPA